MKKILIVDDSNLFREFLSHKLESFGFEITQAGNGLDGILKMRQASYDLIIMDFYLSRNSSIEVLEAKTKNPNTRDTPVIMASAKIDRNSLLQVTQLGVKKFFTKPLKIDILIKALSEMLHVKMEIDTTPCSIEAYFNDGLIFVEVAQGLNWDKIELLKYRLKELVELHKINDPKVLVFMPDLEIGANESLQLASLVAAFQDNLKTKPENIKLLTNSEFIKNFLQKKPTYAGIEIVGTLEAAMDGLSASPSVNPENFGVEQTNPSTGFDLRFEGEESPGINVGKDLRELGAVTNIAIVDDDFVIREIIKKAFSQTGINTQTYKDGNDFLTNSNPADFDMIFLDLLMPEMDGFQVMQTLKEQAVATPIIVLSALSKRETVVKAMGFGIKSYIIKPVQPEEICRKAFEVLRMNF